MRDFWNRYGKYFIFFGATFLVLSALYIWKMTLLPFILGLILAYLFLPLIRRVEKILPGKGKWVERKRVMAIAIVFVTILGVVGTLSAIAITLIIHNSADLIANATNVANTALAKGKELTGSIRNFFPESMRGQVDAAIADATSSMTKSFSSSGTGSGTGSVLTSSLGFIFGFFAVPMFLFYLLKDSEKIQCNIYGCMPSGVSKHIRTVVEIIEQTLGRYIRAELTLGAIVGGMSLVGMLIIGMPFAIPLAVVNGIAEMVPTFGPIIGGAIMAVVALAVAPDKVVWVIVLAIFIQLSENNLIAPKVTSSCLHLHPTLVVMLLVLGSYFWGFWGMVLTVPVTSTLVDMFTYVRQIDTTRVDPGILQKTLPEN
jgi:predicted PurR-regulated permease PerM